MNYGNSKFSIYCHSTYKKYGDLQVDFLGFAKIFRKESYSNFFLANLLNLLCWLISALLDLFHHLVRSHKTPEIHFGKAA